MKFSNRKYLISELAVTLLVMVLSTTIVSAMPRDEYKKNMEQAITALDSLVQIDEGETEADHAARITRTLTDVRNILPQMQDVEWGGMSFKVDNSWLHQQLAEYEKASDAARPVLLRSIVERLHAIEQSLVESEKGGVPPTNKEMANKKLSEILQRSEYVRANKNASALSRLLGEFWKWLRKLRPKQQPLPSSQPTTLIKIIQIVVILLALATLAYVIKLFAPRLFHRRGLKKKVKSGARVVLGERLQPDQSAVDLLAEAELLAKRGELRAAIRKAYIALLVELGERKILTLAQHKTNRDYLRDVREIEPLHGKVKQLTESFERHWYGLVGATEADWLAFRTVYKESLLQ